MSKELIEQLAKEPTEAEYLAHAVEEELLLFADESDYLAIANGVWELFVKRAKAYQAAAPTPDNRSE